MFDSGMVKFYKKTPRKSATGTPVTRLEFYSEVWYGDINFSITEYYAAKQSSAKVVRRVRIQQDRSICNMHVAVIDGVMYEIGRPFSCIEKGILITDLTLEEATVKYDIR